MRHSLPLVIAATLALAFAPAPVYRPRKAEAPSARIVHLMEGFRTKIPPAEGLGEMNGISPVGLPYVPTHLEGVARRMKVKTRAECVALMPYLRDRDITLRYIAQQAIIATTKSTDGGSFGDIRNIDSEGHRKMAERFADLIDRLDR